MKNGSRALHRLAVCLILFTLLALAATLLIFRSANERAKQIDAMASNRETCTSAILSFSNASDYLTTEVWAYATSGDLAHMNNYWSEVENSRTRDKAIETLLHMDLTAQEETHVMRAKAYSDALIAGETWSMRLLAESFGVPESEMPERVRSEQLSADEEALSAQGKREKAQDYLFGEEYALSKTNIRSMVSAFNSDLTLRLDNSTSAAMEANRNANRYAVSIIAVLMLLIAALIYVYARAASRNRLRLTAALKEAEAASTAKTEFLSRMSHDMRTPLNGIIGMTYLTEEMALPDKARENLRKIDTSSKFLLGLINDILDMTKAESKKIELHPEPYPQAEFSAYLDAVIRPLCDGKHQRFAVEADPPADRVPVFDKLHINQVLFNLLSNAVKYTPEGGTITYRAVFGAADGAGRVPVRMEVCDTGVGMSADFQKMLFEPFARERRVDVEPVQGTGLGLAIAKRMVEAMNGTISVRSEIGRGSVFTVALTADTVPAAQAAAAPAAADPYADTKALAGRHVLLCEDHPLNQEIARTLLAEKAIIVELAENGQRGVEAFQRSPLGFYDAILMDIRMPVMNGYEAARAIRALDREDAGTVPILAMTADAFEDDVQRCLEAGMNGHIPKPIQPDRLFLALQKALEPQKEKL